MAASNLPPHELWEHVIAQFTLDLDSVHGPAHWRRVETIGLRIAQDSSADETVVRLFALFHDSRRKNEFDDPEHGWRGADLAGELRGSLFELSDEGFDKLVYACRHHADGFCSDDVTVGTCWDADRLELQRLGIVPCDEYLSTPIAKQQDIQNWAAQLSRRG